MLLRQYKSLNNVEIVSSSSHYGYQSLKWLLRTSSQGVKVLLISDAYEYNDPSASVVSFVARVAHFLDWLFLELIYSPTHWLEQIYSSPPCTDKLLDMTCINLNNSVQVSAQYSVFGDLSEAFKAQCLGSRGEWPVINALCLVLADKWFAYSASSTGFIMAFVLIARIDIAAMYLKSLSWWRY